jgi:hypothetical protein
VKRHSDQRDVKRPFAYDYKILGLNGIWISLAIIYKALMHILTMKLTTQEEPERSDLSFQTRATTALGISIVVDALDYIGAPIFAFPVVGDVVDAAVIAILYRLTGSKTSTAINALEFIPVIGDMIPAYTLSTLLWILRESSHRRKQKGDLLTGQPKNHITSVKRSNDYYIKYQNIDEPHHISEETFRTKAARLYSIFRSKVH